MPYTYIRARCGHIVAVVTAKPNANPGGRQIDMCAVCEASDSALRGWATRRAEAANSVRTNKAAGLQ